MFWGLSEYQGIALIVEGVQISVSIRAFVALYIVATNARMASHTVSSKTPKHLNTKTLTLPPEQLQEITHRHADRVGTDMAAGLYKIEVIVQVAHTEVITGINAQVAFTGADTYCRTEIDT